MKKLIAGFWSIPILLLTGCSAVGDKNASQAWIYGAAALLSLVLLIGCCLVVRKNRAWFYLLFSSVLVVNFGYTLLAVSTGLEMALWANRLSYLGSVFLPLSMLMILLRVTNTTHQKWLPRILFAVAFVVFLVAASPGILDIYYKEVSFETVGGVSKLVKVYGPLHPLYLIYLLGYFSAMVTVVIRSYIKKTIDTAVHAVIITIAVLVNIGVWLIEQISRIDFEMLSVSYIISELFLLGVHMVMKENQRLRELVKRVETVHNYPKVAPGLQDAPQTATVEPERLEAFMLGLQRLTPTEKTVYDAYIARATTKEVMEKLGITENTLKYHNRNLYGKLCVSSRKELLEMYKHIRSVQAVLEQKI